jgi:5-oxoprolinase (ATP-hydrolysing) subunit A
MAAARNERNGIVIDISADLGEGAPDEPEIWPLITSANVACGGHYGDVDSMTHAANRARELGTRIGAHPSYPDRKNFGRKSMSMPPDALRATLIEQITALLDIAGKLHHIKPHGALYNDAHKDRALAEIVIDAIRGIDETLPIVCSDKSQMAAAARAAGTPVIREAFADRRYNADGSLVARTESGSLLTVDEAAAQAAMLANESAVIARDGSRITIPFDTICVHADMEHAVERLRAIRNLIRR